MIGLHKPMSLRTLTTLSHIQGKTQHLSINPAFSWIQVFLVEWECTND